MTVALPGHAGRLLQGKPERHPLPGRLLVVGVALTLPFGAACSGGADNEQLAGRLARCRDCSIQVVNQWAPDSTDPNVQEAGFYLEHVGSLWAMGGFSGETLVRFSLEERSSRAYTLRGDGPGEFADQIMGAAVHASGDTLVIAQVDRVEYFSPDLDFHRGFRSSVPVRGALLVLDSGEVVLSNTQISQANPSGARAVHAFAATGEIIGSFLPVHGDFAGAWLPLARGADLNSVWVAIPARDGFVLEQWDAREQTRLRRYAVSVVWWHPPVRDPARSEGDLRKGRGRKELLTPASGVVGLYDDGSNIWVALRHADPQYVSEVDKDHPAPDRLFDAFVLLLDRNSGAVQAAQVFNEFSYGFTNLGDLVLFAIDDLGRPQLSLLQLAAVRSAAIPDSAAP